MQDEQRTGKGVTGRIAVDDVFITINRKGTVAKMNHGFTKGEKRIPIASVTAVQFKKPGLTNGYVQFTLGGGNENTGGVMAATKDENTVVFSKKHSGDFEAIRDHVERKIAERSSQSVVPAPQAAPPSLATELRELSTLRDEGVLTDDEFEAQKGKLLGS